MRIIRMDLEPIAKQLGASVTFNDALFKVTEIKWAYDNTQEPSSLSITLTMAKKKGILRPRRDLLESENISQSASLMNAIHPLINFVTLCLAMMISVLFIIYI